MKGNERQPAAAAGTPEHGAEQESREAALKQLRKLLDRLEKPERRERGAAAALAALKEFFNSAFVVAALGGLLVALLSAKWQERSERHDKELEEAKKEQANKEKIAFDFARNFPQSLYLVSQFRPRKLWLDNQQGKPQKDRYIDGRSYEE